MYLPNIETIYQGTTSVSKIYQGDVLVWPVTPPAGRKCILTPVGRYSDDDIYVIVNMNEKRIIQGVIGPLLKVYKNIVPFYEFGEYYYIPENSAIFTLSDIQEFEAIEQSGYMYQFLCNGFGVSGSAVKTDSSGRLNVSDGSISGKYYLAASNALNICSFDTRNGTYWSIMYIYKVTFV